MEEIRDSNTLSDGTTLADVYDGTYGTSTKPNYVNISTATALKVIFICIGCTGLIGNLFVLVVLNLTSKRKNRTNVYLVNQSIIDGLVSLFLILTTFFEDGGRYYSTAADEAYCRVWMAKTSLWTMLCSSSYNLLTLTVERYLSIVHPIWHKLKFSANMVKASIVGVWLLGLLTALLAHLPSSRVNSDGSCTVYKWNNPVAGRIMGLMINIFLFFGPVGLFIICCYIRMARALSTSLVSPFPLGQSQRTSVESRETDHGQPNENKVAPSKPRDISEDSCGADAIPTGAIVTDAHSSEGTRAATYLSPSGPSVSHTAAATASATPVVVEERHAKTRKNIFKMLLVVVLCYGFCWVLHICYYTLGNFGLPYPYIDFTSNFYNFTVIMLYINCCVNPVIYATKYEQFQKAAKSLFCKNI